MWTLNNSDPVVSVYGLYGPDGQAASTYQDAINDVQQGTLRSFGVNNPTTGTSFQYEVMTQSGQVYGFYNNNNSYGIGYVNLSTGQTTGINGTTMQTYSLGVTHNSGNDN